MSKKLSFEYVKSEIEKEGYTVISTEYVNNHTKLELRCPVGDPCSMSWNSWQHGYRCGTCAGNKKLTYEFVKSEIEKEGHTLLSKEYIGARSKLELECPAKHPYLIDWCHWQQGQRCKKCADIKLSEKRGGEKNPFYGKHHSIEARKKMSEACSNEKNPFYGKHHSVKTRKEMSKNNSGENHPMYGKHHSVKTRKKMSKAQKGKIPSTEARKKMSKAQKGKVLSAETRKKLSISNSGKNHWNWKGGISCEPYCQVWRDKEFKQYIKERDRNICWDIGYWWKGKPSIHHINYDKKDCSQYNLILVSVGMNSAANKDREWHTEWFQIAMSHRLGYKYN